MANKELKQWITDKLGDVAWGSHQEVKLFETKKKADWAYFYPNGKAILIEDKEKNDTGIDDAIAQLKTYEKICRDNNYNDIIKIAVKDTGTDKIVKVFRNQEFIDDVLKSLIYYEQMLKAKKINDISDEIYKYTSQINQILHDEFNITILKHRMLFTGCILVATKFENGNFGNYGGIDAFKQLVANKITSMFSRQERKAFKINELIRNFLSISIGKTPSNATIENICNICNKINLLLKENPNSDIDIMNIFFTEFNKYRGKSESGQVFTPDHIADLMAKLLNISENDKILDPTCGSGSLLLKASKYNCSNWNNIYGNDNDINVLVLSYINMLLHNDGITNLKQLNAVTDEKFNKWVKENKITKVIANPPYENTYAIDILENILNNVQNSARVIWLMPNNKFDRKASKARKAKLLKHNTLSDIILLPDIFPKIGCGDVSLFIFTKGEPQNDEPIKCWSIPDDGFITVKNQGYKDVFNRWPKIKQEFLERFEQDKYDLLISPKGNLSYPKKQVCNSLTAKDVSITVFQYKLYENSSNFPLLKSFMDLNNKDDKMEFIKMIIDIGQNEFVQEFYEKIPKFGEIDDKNWKEFKVSEIFECSTTTPIAYSEIIDGDVLYITRSAFNNGNSGLIKNVPSKLEKGNCITIGAEGKVAFYQEKEFLAGVKVYTLRNDNLNKNIGLFLCSILNLNIQNYSYSNARILSNIKNEIIKLPVDSDGKPDWLWMEKYIKNQL